MATVHFTLRKRNIKSDSYPIIVRVIHNRKSKEQVVLDIKVKDKDWDKKNQLLKSSYTQAVSFPESVSLQSGLNSKAFSSKNIDKGILICSNANPKFLKISSCLLNLVISSSAFFIVYLAYIDQCMH